MLEVHRLNHVSEKEQQGIADLTINVMKETGYDFNPQLDADLSALEQEYIAPGRTIEVVKDGDKIIGCLPPNYSVPSGRSVVV